jgi:hypothetical protein
VPDGKIAVSYGLSIIPDAIFFREDSKNQISVCKKLQDRNNNLLNRDLYFLY